MEDIHQGWLEMSAAKSKNWLKKNVTKPWKKKFFVLRRDEENTDRVLLIAYDKEENVVKKKPKKTIELFPKYQVAKTNELKGKEFTFQVSNDNESWFLAAKNQKVLDLWVIQIQMQTKLSRSISGRVFSVKAANTKPLQRIGAKDQACLLHFTKWGLTLALQESRSVLALWPLDTIRNYECTGTQQFIFEAGRRSPMGEGKYAFFTYEGDDQAMFNVIDIFVSARLEAKADLVLSRQKEEVTDDDILQAYNKLHSCVLGNPPVDSFDDFASYSRLNGRGVSQPMGMEQPPSYDHLERTGALSSMSDGTENWPPSSYDQLDRTASWSRQGTMTDEAGYNVIDVENGNSFSNNYDHLDRVTADQGSVASGAYNRFGSVPDEACRSPGVFVLHHEPSVPSINGGHEEDDRFLGQRCSSLTSNASSAPYANTASPPERESVTSSSSSTGKKQRRTTVEKSGFSTPVIDTPPPLPPARSKSTDLSPLPTKPVPKPGDPLPVKNFTRQESEYENSK